VGDEILRTRPTETGAHTASYTMGTGSLSQGVKRPGRGFDHSCHPPPWLTLWRLTT